MSVDQIMSENKSKMFERFAGIFFPPLRFRIDHTRSRYNPYSGHYFGLCGHILLQIKFFWFIFRKKTSQTLRCAVLQQFEVRCKVLILAHRIVGQTSKSDLLEPTFSRLKLPGWQKKVSFCQLFCRFQTQFLVNLDKSKLTRLAALGQISTFDTSFDAPGS